MRRYESNSVKEAYLGKEEELRMVGKFRMHKDLTRVGQTAFEVVANNSLLLEEVSYMVKGDSSSWKVS